MLWMSDCSIKLRAYFEQCFLTSEKAFIHKSPSSIELHAYFDYADWYIHKFVCPFQVTWSFFNLADKYPLCVTCCSSLVGSMTVLWTNLMRYENYMFILKNWVASSHIWNTLSTLYDLFIILVVSRVFKNLTLMSHLAHAQSEKVCYLRAERL